jgi:UDP-N-acetylmuramoylalanine--D-glutamate ligase
VSNLWRALPHDITNALAACALVLESGVADRTTLASSLSSFVLAHHRIELVMTNGGVCWYDDSKATSPHASLTAIKGFESIVLIAGGRNKDLDLTLLASEPKRMRGVVAIGEDAALVESAFQGICEIRSAQTMKQAVEQAAAMAKDGDSVLLSPACTSYDWYSNYNERGDDFQRCVRDLCGDQSIYQGSRQ